MGLSLHVFLKTLVESFTALLVRPVTRVAPLKKLRINFAATATPAGAVELCEDPRAATTNAWSGDNLARPVRVDSWKLLNCVVAHVCLVGFGLLRLLSIHRYRCIVKRDFSD